MLFGGTLVEEASHDILTTGVVDWEVSKGKDGIMVGTLRLLNCGSRWFDLRDGKVASEEAV